MSFDIKNIIEELRSEYKKDMSSDLQDWDELYIKYLGKKGLINRNFKIAAGLSPEDKIKLADKLNKLKKEIEEELTAKKDNKPTEQKVDLSAPVESTKTGNLHPLTLVKRDLYQFFHYYG